jgi:hypothetical protein
MKANKLMGSVGAALGMAAAFVLTAGSLESARVEAQANENSKLKKVLLYDRSLRTSHPGYPALRRALRRLSLKHNGFVVDSNNTAGYVTATTLAGVDVAIFHQGDGQVLTSAGETALRNFVEVQGKGVLMIHAAGAFVPCPTNGEENLSAANCNFLAQIAVRQYFHHNNDGTSASIYVDSVKAGELAPGAPTGATPATINHGISNVETKNIFTGLPRRVNGLTDEWYTFRGQPRDQGSMVFNGVTHGPVNVLLSIDEASFTEVQPSLGDHPLAWTRKMGNGLTSYNSIGHSDIYPRQDSIMERFNYRLLRYLARDFVGCMDPAFLEYNPEASVTTLTPIDDAAPCKTPVSIARLEKGKFFKGITATSNGLRISVPEAGAYRILVSDAQGRSVASRKFIGGQSNASVEISGLGKGTYMVRVTAPKSGMSATRVSLL